MSLSASSLYGREYFFNHVFFSTVTILLCAVDLKKTFWSGKRWSLTDVADHTQLGSPDRLEAKQAIVQDTSTTVRRLEQQLQECQLREEKLQRRVVELVASTKETQVSDCGKKYSENKTDFKRVEYFTRRAEESQPRVEEEQRRAEESQQRVEELQQRAQEFQQRVEEWQQRDEELQQRAKEEQRRAEAFQQRAEEEERRAKESERRAQAFQQQLQESNRRVEDANRSAEKSSSIAQEFQRQAEVAEERVCHIERSLAEMRQTLRQCEDRLESYSTHWVIRREEIELTGPKLGVGGWATVTVAKFRGIKVAVKKIHNRIISHHNLQLFQREMNMAARLRHPNLIQFIGATMEGEMMIVMELMATSLRSQLETDVYFPPNTVKAISLDVACGLNYLHLIQPDPIVHRDISSANVLLEVIQLNQWRAKLTDYGSVNVVRQLHTQNPGSPAYSAPEASNPHLQSPKMDIYSFGALVLEMLTGRLPAPDDRPGLLCQVRHEQLLCLIRRCLSERKEDRPSASDIISDLS